MKNTQKKILSLLLIALIPYSYIFAQDYNSQIEGKKSTLQSLIVEAQSKSINIEREKCVIWMADEFNKYANWDETHIAENKIKFETYTDKVGSVQNFAAYSQQLAERLPVFEKTEIIAMLDSAIITLTAEINGSIIRRPVAFFDWKTIKKQDDQFVGENNQPIFVHDYFTKPADLKNEYCGFVDRSMLAINQLSTEKTVNYITKLNLKSTQSGNSGYVMLWHSAAPAWAIAKEPKIATGSRNFTQYDIDNPVVRSAWDTLCSQMVPQLMINGQTAPAAKMGYILSNEPHWYTASGGWAAGVVSDYTKAKFKEWLKVKYNNDIAKLNTLWGSSFANFDVVTMAIPFIYNSTISTPKGYDWQRFNMDRVINWFTFLHDKIRRTDPNANTHIKLMPHCWSDDERDHGLDFEALTDLTEISGNDAQLYKVKTWENEFWWQSKYAYNWKEMMAYDFFKSVKPDQPIFNTEGHFLSTSCYRDMEMKPAYARSAYWFATLQGLNACLTWFWPRDLVTGGPNESILNANSSTDNDMYKSYPGSIIHQPRIANEVAQVYMDLNSFSSEVVKFQRQYRPIRIFYSETSAISKHSHMSGSVFPLYESLFFDGNPLGFVTANIIQKQNKDLWKVVLVYQTEYVTDAEFAALQSYLDNGGTVIIDAVSLKKNEYGQTRTQSLTAGNGSLMQATTLADFKQKAESASAAYLPSIAVEETNGLTQKGCLWRVIPGDNGKYVLLILNIGKNTANIKIKDLQTNTYLTSKDMFTQKAKTSELTLEPENIMLLELDKIISGTNVNQTSNVLVWSGENNVVHVSNAAGKNVNVFNTLGQNIVNREIENNQFSFAVPSGVLIVKVAGEVSKKIIIR